MTTGQTLDSAGKSLLPAGEGIGLFNPLNWKRKDPVELQLLWAPALTAWRANCCPWICPVPGGDAFHQRLRLEAGRRSAAAPEVVELPEVIETSHYLARFDRATGALTSLKSKKPSGSCWARGRMSSLPSGPPRCGTMHRRLYASSAGANARCQLQRSAQHDARSQGPVAWTIEPVARSMEAERYAGLSGSTTRARASISKPSSTTFRTIPLWSRSFPWLWTFSRCGAHPVRLFVRAWPGLIRSCTGGPRASSLLCGGLITRSPAAAALPLWIAA